MLLDRLNQVQRKYDNATATIEAERADLFADWYKYMICNHPPAGDMTTYPDIDGVQHFICMKDFPRLRSLLRGAKIIGPVRIGKMALVQL